MDQDMGERSLVKRKAAYGICHTYVVTHLRQLMGIHRSNPDKAQVDGSFRYRFVQNLTNNAADYYGIREG